MTDNKNLFSTAWDNPRNWEVQFQVDGICYDPLPCVDFGGADEAPATLNDYFCFGKNGRPVKRGTIDNTTFDRSTTTFLARPSEMQPLLEAQKLTEKGVECLFNARIAVHCKRPFDKNSLLGWVLLEDVSLTVGKSIPQLTDARAVGTVGGGAAGEILMTFNASIGGIIDITNTATTVFVGFDNVTANPTAAIYQCLDAICKSGTNLCGDGEVKRGECDEWTQLRNVTGSGDNDFELLISTDGGRNYTLEQTVLDLGHVVAADCDLIVTETTPLELCGDIFRAVPNFPIVTALIDYDGENAIIWSDGATANGVIAFDSAQNEYFISQPQIAAGFTDQSHIDSDGQFILTGGVGDGVNPGADYQFNLSAGEVGNWTQATLNIAGFSTNTDVIQDVNVHDGVMTIVVNNGTNTKVLTSFDGVNFTDAGDFAGVATFVKLRRPSDEITYLVLDDVVHVNYSGVCECDWVVSTTLTNTPDHFEVCSNDPTFTHFTF